MSIDLGRALRDVVDGPEPSGAPAAGPWSADDRLGGLRGRVRRRRAARTATRSAVGVGAACAVGASAAWWPTPAETPAPATSTSVAENGDPVPAPDPVPAADSALCGTALTPSTGGDTLALGVPGLTGDAGTLVGRSIGSPIPVWLDLAGGASSGLSLVGAQVVAVTDGRVVAVADDPATVVSQDPATTTLLAAAQEDSTGGSGALRACPTADASADATAGLAGAVPPAGEYTLHAVVDLADSTGSTEQLVSRGVALTLLPEQPLTDPSDPRLPDAYPADVIPVIGGTIVSAAHFTDGRESWKVVVDVDGTDALERAAAALGAPRAYLGSWERFTGADSPEPLDAQQAATRDAASEAQWWRGGMSWTLGDRYHEGSADSSTIRLVGSHLTVNLRERALPDGTTTLEYLVTRR